MADEHLISLQPGTVIAGRYEVVKCIGAGSMGMAYVCRHRELPGHMVAVKVLFPEVAQDKTASARFRNEIFAAYRVSHPNVVRAYDYLRDGDLVAYTMEYVGGGDLAGRLGKSNEPITVPEVIHLLAQMCAGVQAIHEEGIIHRDLKPENILLTKDGHVKIADFGIARVGHGPKLTEHGGVVGTIDYVSPEYMLNSQVDWRSDIYALGILAYEMLTGESPFRGDSVYATMTKRLKTDPKPPSVLRPECPTDLDHIVLKAMARDPEQRYQAAGEMLLDLQALQPEGQKSGVSYSTPSSGGFGSRSMEAPPSADEAPAPPPAPPRQAPVEQPRYHAGDGGVAIEEPREQPGAASTVVVRTRSAAWQQRPSQPQQQPQRPQPPSAGHHMAFDKGRDLEPAPMERMLSSGSQKDAWARPSQAVSSAQFRAPAISSSVALNSSRLHNLAQISERANSSLWVDIVILVATVLIGVGVGFTVVKFVLPGVLQGGTTHRTVSVPQ